MKIVLRIDGEDKTFTNDFVSAYDVRKAAEINRGILNGELDEYNVEEKIIDFVVNLFGNRFTTEEALKGTRGEDFVSVFIGIYRHVLNLGTESKGGNDNTETNDESGK